MRWHIELYIEVVLFLVLFFRSTNLRWFEILIGVDLAAQILQIIPYRSHYPQFSRLFWESGVVLIAGCRYKALMEVQYAKLTRATWWHARILCFWTTGAIACAFLMVGRPDAVVFRVNTALLVIQAVSFLGWIVVFMLD